MNYTQEIQAHASFPQDVYQGSEIAKGSKNMPLGGKAVANAKEPAQLAVVSECFYNGDISQGGGLRGSTGYGKNTTQHRTKKSSKNKDSKDSNQESNSEFNLGPVYKDLEKKIAEALLPVQLQGDLRSKQVYNFNKKLSSKKLRKGNKNIIQKSHMEQVNAAGFSLSWKQINQDNLTATLCFANVDDIKTIQSLIPNPYVFTYKKSVDGDNQEPETVEITVALEFDSEDVVYTSISEKLQKKQQYIKNKLNVTRVQTKDTGGKIYNRKNEKEVGTQEYTEYVALENQRSEQVYYIQQLFKEAQIDEGYFGKPINSMTLDELLQLDLTPLEDIVNFTNTAADTSENFSQYGLDAYCKNLDEHINRFEAPESVRLATEKNNAQVKLITIEEQIILILDFMSRKSSGDYMHIDEINGRFDAWNEFYAELNNESLDRLQHKKYESMQLFTEYEDYLEEKLLSYQDVATIMTDIENLNNTILNDSNFFLLINYLSPLGLTPNEEIGLPKFCKQRDLFGKTFKEVGNALFQSSYGAKIHFPVSNGQVNSNKKLFRIELDALTDLLTSKGIHLGSKGPLSAITMDNLQQLQAMQLTPDELALVERALQVYNTKTV